MLQARRLAGTVLSDWNNQDAMGLTMAYNSTRELVLARRKAMSTTGKAGLPAGASQPSANARPAASTATSAPVRTAAPAVSSYSAPANSTASVARLASLARREAMSTGGKKSIQSQDRVRTATSGGKGESQASAPTAAAAPAAAAPNPASTDAKTPIGHFSIRLYPKCFRLLVPQGRSRDYVN